MATNIIKFILVTCILFFILSVPFFVLYLMKNINSKKWRTYNSCIYAMTNVYLDILNEYNIMKSYNDDWVIYFPCSYDDNEIEMKYLKELNLSKIKDTNKKIFIIPNSDQLVSKSDMWLNIVDKHGIDLAKTMCPMTYVLYNTDDVKNFQNEYDENKIYILKKNIQRQEGLKITKDKDEIINGFKNGYVVAQELLQNPYTISDRKINLRFYVLVICENNKLNAHVYKDGFMYYTKHAFIPNSLDFWSNVTTGYIDRWVYDVNPLTHIDFKKYLNKKNISSDNVFNNIYKLIANLILSVDDKLCIENDYNFCTTFQLFGVDIALDDKLDPKIIECNKGPNLLKNDDRDGELKTALVKDIFKVINIIDNNHNNFIQII